MGRNRPLHVLDLLIVSAHHCITDFDNWREGLTHSQGCSDKKTSLPWNTEVGQKCIVSIEFQGLKQVSSTTTS